MSKSKKPKKEKSYAEQKGWLDYLGTKFYARLTLATLTLHADDSRKTAASQTISIKGCTVERIDDFLEVGTYDGGEFQLQADSADDARAFEKGVKTNVSLWASGDAEGIAAKEGEKKVRRERRKSVLEAVGAVSEDGGSGTNSPRSDDGGTDSPRKSKTLKSMKGSKSADYSSRDHERKRDKRSRRSSTVMEVQAADEAKALREAEEDSLKETLAEREEKQQELRQLESDLRDLRRRKASAIEDLERELEAEYTENYGEDVDELEAELEALHEQKDTVETQGASDRNHHIHA
jgi:ketosteroid isomerase-like protein